MSKPTQEAPKQDGPTENLRSTCLKGKDEL